MIQLYKSTNTNYDMNGDYTLSPLSCTFECNLNDTWIVNIENVLDQSMNDFINGAVLSVPTPYGDKQLFRIYDYEKTDDGITAIAYPIFLDSKNDCFIWDTRPTNKNGQQALDDMLKSNPKYSASSDIKKISTSYYIQKNFIEALNGQDDNSFLNRWGGEVAYNNFEIIVNEHLGNDNGLRVEFGFNLLGVSEKVDDSNVVTRIIPKAYNGHILPNNETVDSPLINNYPIIHTRVIEYNDIKLKEDSNADEENVIVCNTLNDLYVELRKRANEEFENGIDIPNITYNVDMIDLSKTDLYEDYKDLLKVNLGDTVHVKNRKLNIETKARVISLVYDCITKKVESLVLGQFEPNYFNDVSSITHSVNKVIDTSNNTLMGNKIAGVIDLLKTSLKAQKDIAQKQDVRAILFEDLDTSSPTFGAMCLGTQGIQISKKRNPTNTDWVWGTAIDFQSVIADYIITGILSDKNGKFYLDLDTGELSMKDGTFKGNITGSTINGNTISGGTISGTTITGTDINGNTITGGTITGSKISGTTITGTDINGNTITGGTITGSKIIGSELNTNDQYGTLIIKDGAISYLYYGKLSGKIYLSGITIETGDDIKGKGTLYCTSSIKTDAQILADGNIRGNKGGFFNGEVSARKYNTTSDIRLKENINNVDLESIFDFVHVKSFNYKNSLKRTVGVIAQDFVGTPYEEIIISRNEDGYYSVDYNVFTMALVQEVCRLRQKIKEFEEYKENIEKRLKRLEELHGNNN